VKVLLLLIDHSGLFCQANAVINEIINFTLTGPFNLERFVYLKEVSCLKANTTILGFRVIQWFSKWTTLFVSIDDRWAFFILTLQLIFKGLKCGSLTG